MKTHEVYGTWWVTKEQRDAIKADPDSDEINIHVSMGWVNEDNGTDGQLFGVTMNDEGAYLFISGTPEIQTMRYDTGATEEIEFYEIRLIVPVNPDEYGLDPGDTFWFSPNMEINGEYVETDDYGMRPRGEKEYE